MFHSLLAPGQVGSSASTTLDLTIRASEDSGFDLWEHIKSKVPEYSVYNTFNVTIAAGVTLGSNSTSTPGFTTGSGWPTGAVLSITNNGIISGAGGDGGDYTSGNGSNGGTAMVFTIDATLTNNGTIQGGGGGGGGGTNSVEQTIGTTNEQQGDNQGELP